MLAVSLPALAFTMVCALGFAASDYFRKVASETMPPVVLLTVFIGGQVPLIGIWFWLSNAGSVEPGYWPYGLAAAAAGLFANLLFIMAMKVSALSLVVPMLALVPVFTTAFGVVALGEIPTAQQAVGIGVTVVGLAWLYLPDDNPRLIAVIRRFATDRGARYMIVVALMWSATAPLDKIAVQLSAPATHAFIQVCLIGVALVIYMIATKRTSTIATIRHAIGPASLASLTAGIAYGCQLVAYQLTLIGVVESLKRVTGLLSALLLGWILLHEPLTRTKIFGITLVGIGVPLIILPSLF